MTHDQYAANLLSSPGALVVTRACQRTLGMVDFARMLSVLNVGPFGRAVWLMPPSARPLVLEAATPHLHNLCGCGAPAMLLGFPVVYLGLLPHAHDRGGLRRAKALHGQRTGDPGGVIAGLTPDAIATAPAGPAPPAASP